MKGIIILLLLTCFLISSCAKPQLSPHESNQKDNFTPICELVDNPYKYDSQEIHAKVIFYEDKFTGFIYDPECMRADQRVSFEFDEKNSTTLSKKLSLLDEVFLPGGISRASANITGKFFTKKKDRGLGLNNIFNQQIVISEIKDVQPVPISVKLPQNYK